jgi:hypothetical protein
MVAWRLYQDLSSKRETRSVAFTLALYLANLRMGDNVDLILMRITRGMKEISQKGYKFTVV